MADAKTATFESIMRDLKARKFMPVYYLMGDESYYIDRISDYIADNALPPEERDFNQTVMFGSDVTAAQVADAAKRYPMMSEYQVLIVKEAQNLKNIDALEFYIKSPLRSTILVLCHKNGFIDKRKKALVAAIEKNGVLFESKKLRDLPAAPADGLDLLDDVRPGQQRLRAGEQPPAEVGAQAVADHGHVEGVHQLRQEGHLLPCDNEQPLYR